MNSNTTKDLAVAGCEQQAPSQRSASSEASTAAIPTGKGACPLAPKPMEVSSSSSDGQASADSTTLDGNQKKKRKLDRSKLRKGKWTIEEEEYTSRIIQYFSSGLLTLPEGSTLRSYLAEKLNCDPMRITKKYAGASCLGRRMYQYRDRPQPSFAEVQLAKAELDHLERRYKQRIEDGRSDPSTPSPNLLLAFTPQVQGHTITQNIAQNIAPSAGLLPAWLNPPPILRGQVPVSAPTSWPVPLAPTSSANQWNWILPSNLQTHTLSATSNPAVASLSQSSQSFAASLAQATATLAPLLSQLASAQAIQNQHQDRAAQVVSATTEYAPTIPSPAPQDNDAYSQALVEKLKETFESHLQRSGIEEPSTRSIPKEKHPMKPAAKSPASTSAGSQHRARTDDERQDGSILLGFLQSLQQSYEDALREKVGHTGGTSQPQETAQVTDSSSMQQNESSMEDSDYDKKTEPSSSEDSDKECIEARKRAPPRKRLKSTAGYPTSTGS